MRKKALTMHDREILVINWFAIRIQHDNEDMASMSEIARGLGMSPSSHLRKILNHMVEVGALEQLELIRPGRWKGWGYKLKSGTLQRPEKRTIPINFTVRGIKQQEMFADNDYGFECKNCGKPMSYRYCGMCFQCEMEYNG